MTFTDFCMLALAASMLLVAAAWLAELRYEMRAWWRGDWRERALADKTAFAISAKLNHLLERHGTNRVLPGQVTRAVYEALMEGTADEIHSVGNTEETHEAGEGVPQNPA